MSALLARYRALPRVARWGIWGAAALVAYLLVVEPIVEKASLLHARASEVSARLVALDHEAQFGEARDAVLAAARFGAVTLPDDRDVLTPVFDRKIAEILERHGVRRYVKPVSSRSHSPGPLANWVGTGKRAERRIAEVQFEGTPETVAAVLADLERAPEVSAVSSVQVRKGEREGSRLVQATIAAEAWMVAERGASR